MENLIEKKAEVLKAIAQPTRLRILEMLRDGECCVCEMMAFLKEDQANISKHLSLMKQADIVEFRKEGVSSYYRIKHPEVLEIIDLAGEIIRKEVLSMAKMMKETGLRKVKI